MASDRELTAECAGCGAEIPYRVGEQRGDGCFGEFLSTPLGDCYRRTCWDHDCVRRSREAVKGRPIKERVSAAERATKNGLSSRPND